DIPLLVRHFLSHESPPRSIDALPANAWEQLRTYRWPGNVRELRNVVQRLLLTPWRALKLPGGWGDAPVPRVVEADEGIVPLRQARVDANHAFEREYVRKLLRRTHGNVTRAAAIAQVSRQVMTKLVRKHAEELVSRVVSTSLL